MTKRRLSQAISEGDGSPSPVSTAPMRRATRRPPAPKACSSRPRKTLASVRGATELPILVVHDPERPAPEAADACIVDVDGEDREWLERIRVDLSEHWELALDRQGGAPRVRPRGSLDPEVLVLRADGDEPLVDALELLQDVPAGKLAIADVGRQHRPTRSPRRARRHGRGHRLRRRRRPGRVGPARSLIRGRGLAEPSRWATGGSPSGRFAGAAAIRLVGVGLRPPLPAPEPRRGEHRSAGMGDAPRRRARPRVVRLPDAAHVRDRAVPGLGRQPVVPRGPARRSRLGPGRHRGCVVARHPRAWDDGGVRRRCGHRRRGDARRLLPHGGHGRADDTRSRSRARVDGHAASARRGSRDRNRSRLQVPAFILLVPLVVAGWGQWRWLATSAALCASCVRGDEPVLRRPFVLCARRRSPRTGARLPRLARLRGRLADADRVPRPLLE